MTKTYVLIGFVIGQAVLYAFGIQTPKESILVAVQVASALGLVHFLQT